MAKHRRTRLKSATIQKKLGAGIGSEDFERAPDGSSRLGTDDKPVRRRRSFSQKARLSLRKLSRRLARFFTNHGMTSKAETEWLVKNHNDRIKNWKWTKKPKDFIGQPLRAYDLRAWQRYAPGDDAGKKEIRDKREALALAQLFS